MPAHRYVVKDQSFIQALVKWAFLENSILILSGSFFLIHGTNSLLPTEFFIVIVTILSTYSMLNLVLNDLYTYVT